MSAVISSTAEYALQAIVCLAADPGKQLTAQQIAKATGVPNGYLSLIMGCLNRARLLHARRGMGGGFQLARPPAALTMWDVVQVFDPLWPSWSPPGVEALRTHSGGYKSSSMPPARLSTRGSGPLKSAG